MAKQKDTLDPFAYLTDDHRKVVALFKDIKSAEADAQQAIFMDIRDALLEHMELEEHFLYPVLEGEDGVRDAALEGVEEHKEVKTLLEELFDLTPDDDEWKPKLTVLSENVDHHVEEEEKEMFKLAKKSLSDEDIATIGENMSAYLKTDE